MHKIHPSKQTHCNLNFPVGHQIRYNGLITFRNPGPTGQSRSINSGRGSLKTWFLFKLTSFQGFYSTHQLELISMYLTLIKKKKEKRKKARTLKKNSSMGLCRASKDYQLLQGLMSFYQWRRAFFIGDRAEERL